MVERIKADIKNNAVAFIVIFVVWATVSFVFHRFCPMVFLCGLPCPGCGMTRAFWSLVTLHPIRAFEYNPSYPLWLGMMIAFVVQRYVRGGDVKKLQIPLFVVCLLTVLIYVWRMTHCFPGTEPMVYTHDNLVSTVFPPYERFIDTFFLQK